MKYKIYKSGLKEHTDNELNDKRNELKEEMQKLKAYLNILDQEIWDRLTETDKIKELKIRTYLEREDI